MLMNNKVMYRMADGRIARLEKEPTCENIAEAISEDAAGRNDDLVAFVELLRRIDGPSTVMLDAPWGEGKTFFVKSAQMRLVIRSFQRSIRMIHESAKL